MATIADINEAWNGHSGSEVEAFIKSQLTATLAGIEGKIGYVTLNGTDIEFYDSDGGTKISTISLSGDIYTISATCSLGQTFYVLADETEKNMTITPSTSVSQFGSSTSESYPESYSYTVQVNTGGGYIQRLTGTIAQGGSATFNIRPYLATGDNYIRVSLTGASSGQTRSIVYVGVLTTLSLSVSHTWQNVWSQGSTYILNGIRFAGSVQKVLHVKVNGTECDTVTYQPNQSYTSSATTYTIPANKFPASSQSGAYPIEIWMTAEGGVTTKVYTYNIICVKTNDTTPLIAINKITSPIVNYTTGLLFSYTLHNANKAVFTMAATLGSTDYSAGSNIAVEDLLSDAQLDFRYNVEVDTGDNANTSGTFSITGKAYNGSTLGKTNVVTTDFDNTYSYIATSGALFYMNAASRNNTENNKTTIVNEANPTGTDATRFPSFTPTYGGAWASLSTVWEGFGWDSDPSGIKAFCVPAGLHLYTSTSSGQSASVKFQPLKYLSSYDGMTLELMVQFRFPTQYDVPLITFWDSDDGSGNGIKIYPTKIVVFGTNEREETVQSVNFCENKMTHICLTWAKTYEDAAGHNLCSIYINGIANSSFSFQGASSFGANPTFTLGTSSTNGIIADTYLYKMRVYGKALESTEVFNNFLNCVVDGVEFNRRSTFNENNILDGSAVDYNLCKNAGYNIMVVTLPTDNSPLPMYGFGSNKYDGCSLRFEYGADSTKNVEINNVSIDGQGTTSKKYYRWNLRAKTSSLTQWHYADGTSVTGKEGMMINDSSYIKVDRITAKKNYASSMQGHKIGMTGLYNDLFKQIGLGSHLPDSSYLVAVYQFPFVGFRYYETSGVYEFIGIYTTGPDKGSKVSFGYIKSKYPNCLSLEGPNHAPRATRFLDPWVDVTYSPDDETLCFGGDEGWDCDYVKYETSTEGTQSDWDSILGLYESEWKPAYECVFNNSPYIVSASEMATALGVSTNQLSYLTNASNTQTILAGTTNGYSNGLLCFYDTNYDIYFYRRSTSKFEKLSSVSGFSGETNARTPITTYLPSGATSSPTTAQIVTARKDRFRATAGNYWDIDQTIYHYAFCILFGVSDNFAKNTYPFKFRGYNETLGTGESTYCKRWGWREDDMDTVLMTDNNGNNTKEYYVEHGDKIGDVDIFQGGTSALWTLIRDAYSAETGTMMGQIASAAASIASSLNIQGEGLHGSLLNVVSHYCWERSSKYFSATLYEKDRRWAYIEPWIESMTTTYNGVYPLTQALGDQYQGEYLWMERRIAYIFSKYRVGAFTGTTEGYNEIGITLASPFTFNLTPAIYLYPVTTSGSTDYQADRTPAGTSRSIYTGGIGDTNNYIKGVDWLQSLGDLSGMVLSGRGSSVINFAVYGKRLTSLTVGGESNVLFNATSLSVASPSITTINAKNTTTLSNDVDLRNCPRLRSVNFSGSGATGLILPIASLVSSVVFPNNASLVFLHSLSVLEPTSLTLPTATKIVSMYINNCTKLDPFGLAMTIKGTSGSTLANLTIIWSGVKDVSSSDISNIISLASLTGKVTYNNGSIGTQSGSPHVEGTVNITGYFYQSQIDSLLLTNVTTHTSYSEGLSTLFGSNFRVRYQPDNVSIEFADDYVKAICLTNWDTNEDGGLTAAEAQAVTSLPIDTFRGNTDISSFNEFQYFDHITSITGSTSSPYGSFAGCTNLASITLPDSITEIGARAFYGCSSLTSLTLPSGALTINQHAFANCTGLTGSTIRLLSTYTVGQLAFQNCKPSKLYLQQGITFSNNRIIEGSTSGVEIHVDNLAWACGVMCGPNGLSNCTLGSHGITATAYLYLNDTRIDDLVVPSSVTGIAEVAFQCFTFSSVTIPSSVTSIGKNAFCYCKGINSVTIQATTPPTVGANAFTNGTPNNYPIYVPSASVDTYKAASGWSSYASRIQAIP